MGGINNPKWQSFSKRGTKAVTSCHNYGLSVVWRKSCRIWTVGRFLSNEEARTSEGAYKVPTITNNNNNSSYCTVPVW